jgi:hypothetical protein
MCSARRKFIIFLFFGSSFDAAAVQRTLRKCAP